MNNFHIAMHSFLKIPFEIIFLFLFSDYKLTFYPHHTTTCGLCERNGRFCFVFEKNKTKRCFMGMIRGKGEKYTISINKSC